MYSGNHTHDAAMQELDSKFFAPEEAAEVEEVKLCEWPEGCANERHHMGEGFCASHELETWQQECKDADLRSNYSARALAQVMLWTAIVNDEGRKA